MELLGPVNEEALRLRKGPVSYSKHGPKKIVAAASFSGLDSTSLTDIQIIGFGVAFVSSSPPPTLGCPIQLFPLELIFGCPASAMSDVWQLAAIIFYTYTGSYMFQVGFPIFIHLVSFIVQFHGPLPSHWRGKFDWGMYGGAYAGEPVASLREPDWWFDGTQSTKSFDDRIAKEASYLSESQRKELAHLLRDMVALEPSRRITAAEADRRLRSPVLSSIQGIHGTTPQSAE